MRADTISMRKLLLQLLLYPTLLAGFCAYPVAVYANTSLSLATDSREILFADDFSQGFDQWEDTYDTFELWKHTEGQAEAYIPRRSTTAELVPKDEHWNPNWQNIVVTFDYTSLKGADKNFAFWVQDKYNWYGIHFTSGAFHLSDVQGGKVVWSHSGFFPMQYGNKYKVELQLNNGHIVLLMNGQKIIDQVSPYFKSTTGKFALRAGAGSAFPTQVFFDSVVVRAYQETVVTQPHAITPLKQTDPRWANILYNSANTWSPQKDTIADWGCLLTSLVMLLENHAITTFADATQINPETLNAWLLSQPDGYVGKGLVNIPSVMRMVRESSAAHGTTKLEYQRHVGSDITIASEHILGGLPVIFEGIGHFFVGVPSDSTTQNQLDPAILDPFYSYTTLSEHSQGITSTRTFTPSMTDLSYIVVAADTQIITTITAADGNSKPENYTSVAEALYSPTQNIHAPQFIVHEIAKPKPQDIYLTVESNTPLENHPLQVFTYDEAGDLTNLSLESIPTHITQTTQDQKMLHTSHFTLRYGGSISESSLLPTQPTTEIEPPKLTFEQLIQKLHNEQKITRNYIKHELIFLWNQAVAVAQNPEQKTYIGTRIMQLIEWHGSKISPEAVQEMREYIAK